MADRKESWSQLLTLLLQTIVPLVIAGGATGILSIFKESLPQSLYSILLYVIWFAIIALLIWLVLRLILGDSPRKLVKWVKDHRQHRIKRKQAEDLFDKWFELYKLISDVIKTDWQPTKEHKSEYFKLHFWFIKNRPKFLHHWYYFDACRTDAAHETDFGSVTDLAYKVFRTNYKDPFSYFYEPQTIEMLCRILENEPIGKVYFVLGKLADLTTEFLHWARLK